MITYLRLENFRRHGSTELRFDEASQVVLIAGANGAGKSSIIEGIIYALYGEGRYGNKWLDRLVRRGSDLEGMDVEMVFDVGGVLYRVTRRRADKMSSAVLYANEVALVEGSRDVTREVSQIFGMDAKGFRLAVVAQQKELSGLSSMRPGDRGVMLSRLLRLDALTIARDQARGRYRAEKEALRGLGSVGGDGLERDVSELRAGIASREAALEEGVAAIGTLDSELAAGAAVEAAWLAASTNSARVSGLVESSQGELRRIEKEIAGVHVASIDTTGIDMTRLDERGRELAKLISEGEVAAGLLEQSKAVAHELEVVEARLAVLRELLLGEVLSETEAQTAREVAEVAREVASRELALVREERASVAARVELCEASLVAASSLGALCDECGQVISEEHRESQLLRAREILGGLSVESTLLEERCVSAVAELERASSTVTQAVTGLEEAKSMTRARSEIDELSRRGVTYAGQLERMRVSPVNLDELYAARALLEAEVVVSRERLEAASLAEMSRERLRGLEERLGGAVARLEEASSWAEQATIDTDLEAAHGRLVLANEARRSEALLVAGLREELAASRERLVGLERERERVGALEERRRGLENSGAVASVTASVLERVGVRLNQQIRPQLEGGISEILARMSDGRFDAVTLDADYTLRVRDDGQFRPLEEFSGGEIDLIALSVRLALAEVVSERHGAGGAGFLILDECFGSQDESRRTSILTALRSLRGTYGQIFLISHVGGLEDAADVVVEVGIDEVTGMATASVES
jgi:exonuclease SbcC